MFDSFGSDSTPGFIPTIPSKKNGEHLTGVSRTFNARVAADAKRQRDTDRAYDDEFPTIGEAILEGRLSYEHVRDDLARRDEPRRSWF